MTQPASVKTNEPDYLRVPRPWWHDWMPIVFAGCLAAAALTAWYFDDGKPSTGFIEFRVHIVSEPSEAAE